MKTIHLLFTFALVSSIKCASVKRKRREVIETKEAPNWTYRPSNCSDKSIDVLLRDSSSLPSQDNEDIRTKLSQTGLVNLYLPGASGPLYLCFPQNSEGYRQAYILSHIICRQLGFMSFASMNSKLTLSIDPGSYLGLKPTSFSCTGQEQNVSHCEWNNAEATSCEKVMELSCGDCQYTVKDSSGFLEVPGYPLVDLPDVTCEWDLMIQEDHSVSLSFLNFKSLFSKTSKSFCNQQEPYLDIMYGKWNELRYQRFCNLDDVKNMNIPHERIKIRIFTGVFPPYGFKTGEGPGKGVAISYKAEPFDKSSKWWWDFAFVALFVIIIAAIIASLHYCKKFGLCDHRRIGATLPTVNIPTMRDIDRAYEFQRCAIQKPDNNKMGLRLRSNGSGEKLRTLFTANPDSTFLVASAGSKYEILNEDKTQVVHIETPRTIIPEIVLTGATEERMDPVERVRINLLDRFARNSCDSNLVSGKVSTSSPVFFSPQPSFQIHRSESSEKDKDDTNKPPPYQSALSS